MSKEKREQLQPSTPPYNRIQGKDSISFWYFDDKGKVKLIDSLFIEYIENLGYRKIYVGGLVVLVKIKGNIVSIVTPPKIKDEVLTLHDEQKIRDYLIRNCRIWSLSYLDALKTETLEMHRDTATSSFYYYKNGVVEVTKDEVKTPVPYKYCGRFVWEEHILNRDFRPLNIAILDKDPAIFEDFLKKQCNNDPKRFAALLSIIGYCLHDFKTSANSRAVIIGDENVNDKPEGGSGKGIIVKAISKVRKIHTENGKAFDPKERFAWQCADETIHLFAIDDIKSGFDFEALFSVITEGMSIERKNQGKYFLPIEICPKIILTTNRVVKCNGGSFSRRQYNIEIHQYFGVNRTPQDEYGQIFFTDWDSIEWNKFDNLMLSCVQMYLKNGVLSAPEQDSQKKNAIRVSNYSFVEWFEDAITDMTGYDGTTTQYAKEQYLTSSGQRNMRLSDKKFIGYIKEYCEHYGYEYIKLDNFRPRRFRIKIK